MRSIQAFLRPALLRSILVVLLALAVFTSEWHSTGGTVAQGQATVLPEAPTFVSDTSSSASVQRASDGSFQYLVNGKPDVFIGMGYNPIYRYLSDAERAANYDRDFRRLCRAGVNHIIGWDADKGYEQDKFDELTLDYAEMHHLGVVMPFYLPADGNYEDPVFLQEVLDAAAAKVARYKGHPALRMWGVGNEVLNDMTAAEMREPFARFWVQLVDRFHYLDPSHPVIYRAAEDLFVPMLQDALSLTGEPRPWLLFGVNVYTPRLESILATWPSVEPDRPLLVTEFGAEPYWYGGRGSGYLDMWRSIRAYPDWVLGGAPYVWTTEGPEPVDGKWGLMDGYGQSVDDTYALLAAEWRAETGARDCR